MAGIKVDAAATCYSIPDEDRSFLQQYCRDQLEKTEIARERITKRTRLLGEHGKRAAQALFAHLCPDAKVDDADVTIRANNPGFDLLVDGWMRVQVKGRSWVELIDFEVAPLSSASKWKSDLWLVVDFAPLVDGRYGPYVGTNALAPKGAVDWYIAPTRVIRELVSKHFGENADTRIRLWAGKVPKFSRGKNHYPELFGFRNAFQTLTAMVHQGRL